MGEHDCIVSSTTGTGIPANPLTCTTSSNGGIGGTSSITNISSSNIGGSTGGSNGVPPTGKCVRVGFYDIEKTIGKGNFAVVKLARHRVTKNEVSTWRLHLYFKCISQHRLPVIFTQTHGMQIAMTLYI